MSNIYWSLFQAEEEYNEAKSVYTKLHAELYEELPALFDRLELLQYFYQFFFVRSSDIHVAPLQFTRVLHYRRYLLKEPNEIRLNINCWLPFLMSRMSTFSLLKVPIDSQLPHVQMGASEEMQQGRLWILSSIFFVS